MITFLLHGGVTGPQSHTNKSFFQKIIKLGGNKILLFPFAQKDKNYQLQFDIDKQKFENHNPNQDITYTMASLDQTQLLQQIQEHKSLYFCGGIIEHYNEILDGIENRTILLQNKIVAGSSAGAMIWADAYYSDECIDGYIYKGFGLIPIKLMVHRQSETYTNYNQENLEKLKAYGDIFLPVITIKEQEYITYTI